MNIKTEIIKNLNNLNVADYDQSVKGKGHYKNLSTLVCNLLNVGFTDEEVVQLIKQVGINCKDLGMVRRWSKFLKTQKPNNSLGYFVNLLNCKFENVEIPKFKENVYEKLSVLKMNKDHKNNRSKIKDFLSDYELQHINNCQFQFKNVGDFIQHMFPDIDKEDMFGLVSNLNRTQKAYFNLCKIHSTSNKNLNSYTHFCLNRPYLRDKDYMEGVAETDIFDARYFLIEVDEGLTIEEQIKFADMLIDNNVPVKMVTHSGGKSVHIIVDLKIRVLEKLKEMNKLSGKHGLTNYCNITLSDLIDGYTTSEIENYFGTNNANDYYKSYIKNIYNKLFALGIKADNACKNLNRWTRIPNGVRESGGKKILQTLLYFREENTDCIDTLRTISEFEDSVLDKMNYTGLFDL